jgi:hypothetical protein
MRQPLNKYNVGLAMGTIVFSFGVGSFLVSDLGASPTAPRDPSHLVCSSSSPKVCVWPEHRERLQEVADLASQATIRWRHYGIEVPSEFTEQSNLSLAARDFGFSVQTTYYQLLHSLAYSILPAYPECALNGTLYLGGQAEDYVLAWLDATADMPQAELESRFEADILQTIAVIQSLPVEQQRIWVEQNMNALGSCDVEPRVESPL